MSQDVFSKPSLQDELLKEGLLILDFGSQFTKLIARRFRELGFYTEIHPYNLDLDRIKQLGPRGIVLSGGPNSVFDVGSPQVATGELMKIAPLLGICYGMQLIVQSLGGRVEASSNQREYGSEYVHWLKGFSEAEKFKQGEMQKTWMSHGDVVTELPPDFELLAESGSKHPAVVRFKKRILALQFHPEVAHTEGGGDLLKLFAQDFCALKGNWRSDFILEEINKKCLQLVGDKSHVLCALSGGVDSTVVAVLLTKLLGRDRVHSVFVNTGLLRKGEYQEVLKQCAELGLNVQGIDATERFLKELSGVFDPEKKRKIIGKTFIDVFDQVCNQLSVKPEFLAQGTLYPDVIESVSSVGGSVTIKSHHNVGGLPEKMQLKLVEPVRELFKDEVRELGLYLGIKKEFVFRHPFPGPGLAIRILGEVNAESLILLQEADLVFINYLKEKNLYNKIWQAFCVLLPVQTVGVMGDGRTYEKLLAIRAVTSSDGMTADWFDFNADDLREISRRITNQVRGINRVVYDITSKPPATIEWE